MKEHKEVSALLQQAKQERRCCYGTSDAQRRALKRRLHAGELVSPYKNLYADRILWNTMTREQQSLQVIRALSAIHPQWVFAGLSAACVYGLQHNYSLHDGTVHIASKSGIGGESLMRGQIAELSFGIPLLQVQFMNPDNPAMPYRVDFCWKLADGRIIVAEYDGMAKYADTSNENRASLQAKMEYDRRRDRHLREQGVTEIVHVFYEDLLRPINLETKLLKAGVPKIR